MESLPSRRAGVIVVIDSKQALHRVEEFGPFGTKTMRPASGRDGRVTPLRNRNSIEFPLNNKHVWRRESGIVEDGWCAVPLHPQVLRAIRCPESTTIFAAELVVSGNL